MVPVPVPKPGLIQPFHARLEKPPRQERIQDFAIETADKDNFVIRKRRDEGNPGGGGDPSKKLHLLNQQDLGPQAARTNGGRGPGGPPSGHHQVKPALDGNVSHKPKGLFFGLSSFFLSGRIVVVTHSRPYTGLRLLSVQKNSSLPIVRGSKK